MHLECRRNLSTAATELLLFLGRDGAQVGNLPGRLRREVEKASESLPVLVGSSGLCQVELGDEIPRAKKLPSESALGLSTHRQVRELQHPLVAVLRPIDIYREIGLLPIASPRWDIRYGNLRVSDEHFDRGRAA